MLNKIEDLATELWLEIFSYLTVSQQFHSFYGLNKNVDEILFSHRSHISLKNNDENTQYLFKHVLPYLTHRKDVTALRLEKTKKMDFDGKDTLFYFPRLKTLFLHRLNISTFILSFFNQNVTNLRYLHISPSISGDKTSFHNLMKMILSATNLQICRLRLGISMSLFTTDLSTNSSIKYLHLIGPNEILHTNRLIELLEYLPYLEILKIIANQISFGTFRQMDTKISRCSVAKLQLNINTFGIPFIQFANFLSNATPNVEELKIICRTPLGDLTYLQLQEWIALIQSLTNVKLIVLDVKRSNEINEQAWDRRHRMLNKIMARKRINFLIQN